MGFSVLGFITSTRFPEESCFNSFLIPGFYTLFIRNWRKRAHKRAIATNLGRPLKDLVYGKEGLALELIFTTSHIHSFAQSPQGGDTSFICWEPCSNFYFVVTMDPSAQLEAMANDPDLDAFLSRVSRPTNRAPTVVCVYLLCCKTKGVTYLVASTKTRWGTLIRMCARQHT